MRNLPPVRIKKVRRPDKASLLSDEEELHMNERAILMIINILNGYTEPPKFDWPEQKKEEIIFTHWALEESLFLILDHPWTLASDTIEEFAMKLEVYMAMAVSESQKRIFTVAAKTARELLKDIQLLES